MPISFSTDELYSETVAKAFLQFYERTAQVVWNQFMEATWNYVTNITNKNREEMVWDHFHPGPFSPRSSQGPRGLGEAHLLPPVQSRRKEGRPKAHVKAGCKLQASREPSGQEALASSPHKFHLLAFRDQPCPFSLSANFQGFKITLKVGFGRRWGLWPWSYPSPNLPRQAQ